MNKEKIGMIIIGSIIGISMFFLSVIPIMMITMIIEKMSGITITKIFFIGIFIGIEIMTIMVWVIIIMNRQELIREIRIMA